MIYNTLNIICDRNQQSIFDSQKYGKNNEQPKLGCFIVAPGEIQNNYERIL